MVGEPCLPNNAYFPWTHDHNLSFRVHVCSSEHSELSFVYLSFLYGLSTLTIDFFFSLSLDSISNHDSKY